ncbi:MAG TPA: hypothetical protein VF721_02505 [Pyrinomonadaceae bacterium]|jgi:hypothetical protein
MKYLFLVLLCVITLAASALAQQTAASKVTAEIIASSSTSLVKGAPFSAEAISESTQILADGNKISRSFTVRMYRDSEGRFRREEVPGASGTGSLLGSHQMISIFDPVANQRLILDPTKKTARRMPVPAGMAEGAFIVNGQSMSPAVRAQVETNAIQRTSVVVLPTVALTTSTTGGKPESLGTRNFDGVDAEGTRTVTTIPAGAIGNERPIETVYEKWYSKELQLIVYSKLTDPRFGEQIYRMENISRNEPDRSLFTTPSDYKLITEPTYNVLTTRPTYIPRAPGAIMTPGTVVTTTPPDAVTVPKPE